MAINLLRGRWWPIVCPTSGALRNVLKGCTPGAVRTLFLALTNYHGYIRLQVIILVTQVTRGLPELVQRWSINLVLLWYVEGKRPGSNCTDDSTWKWGGGVMVRNIGPSPWWYWRFSLSPSICPPTFYIYSYNRPWLHTIPMNGREFILVASIDLPHTGFHWNWSSCRPLQCLTSPIPPPCYRSDAINASGPYSTCIPGQVAST